jgi:hypothetical protein
MTGEARSDMAARTAWGKRASAAVMAVISVAGRGLVGTQAASASSPATL